jgi:uncharacterized phage-associated protein
VAKTSDSESLWKPSAFGDSGDRTLGHFPTHLTETMQPPQAAASTSAAFEKLITIPKITSPKIGPQGRRAKAIDVAQYLIYLAASEPEPESLTHMRLQKLLYYVQGWSLALRNRPMFPERIEAWAHGPVVPNLYPRFADFGDKPISPEDMLVSGRLSQRDREFIESVWEAYKAYSSSSLRAMTHDESPWRDARGKCGPADRCTNEITPAAMRKFFKQASRHREQE